MVVFDGGQRRLTRPLKCQEVPVSGWPCTLAGNFVFAYPGCSVGNMLDILGSNSRSEEAVPPFQEETILAWT